MLGADRHLHFELRAPVQKLNQIGSAYIDFGTEVPETSALTQTRVAMHAFKRGRVSAGVSAGWTAMSDLPALVGTAKWKYVVRRNDQSNVRMVRLPQLSLPSGNHPQPCFYAGATTGRGAFARRSGRP